MAYLSLADLIAGPVRLAPAEAAALTLAVARRLDDEAAEGREAQLPDDHGILLSSTGAIAFVRGPQSAIGDCCTALSALLMRLLRLEDGRPREHVPGGLLIVLARNLGYIQLPPTSADAFRAALERFATSDPAILAGVFWRAARATGAVRRHPRNVAESSTPVERRRSGATRADLRRSIREMERELYNTRVRLAHRAVAVRQRRSPSPPVPSRTGLRWAGLAAGVVLLASMAVGNSAGNGASAGGGSEQPDVELAASTVAETRPAEILEAGTPVEPPVVLISTAADVRPEEPVRTVSVRRRPVSRPAVAVSTRPPKAERRSAKRDALARQFAGGARSIPWATQR